ncbi:hypothetical protein J4413_01105 [Candidatus Woesearchaeota archaeon]|nr:hypothetical protein [Candidatus Woesearchaeota archaeon]
MRKTNIYEFIGVIIGDGSLLYNPKRRVYRLEIAGNATEDYPYFLKLKQFMVKSMGYTPKIRFRTHKKGRSICLYLDNKKFLEFMKSLDLPFGKKTFTITIPSNFLNWKYSKHIIRGIFESDGSLYFSKSKITTNKPTYPRIEIKTSSEKLVYQIKSILSENGFSVQTIAPKRDKATKIYISGERMLNKWIDEIGFSSRKNLTKYLYWDKLGYYTPRSTLRQRETLLKSP